MTRDGTGHVSRARRTASVRMADNHFGITRDFSGSGVGDLSGPRLKIIAAFAALVHDRAPMTTISPSRGDRKSASVCSAGICTGIPELSRQPSRAGG